MGLISVEYSEVLSLLRLILLSYSPVHIIRIGFQDAHSQKKLYRKSVKWINKVPRLLLPVLLASLLVS